MRKKLLAFLLTLCALILSGCQCEHNWIDANCTTAKTCSKCEKTEGNAPGHSWDTATCEESKRCSVCGITEGEPMGHSFVDANCVHPKTCSKCAATEGLALGHSYSDWIDDGNLMKRLCTICNDTEIASHYEVLARQFVVGKWESFHMKYLTELSGVSLEPDASNVVFYENGTFVLESDYLTDNLVEGTWIIEETNDESCYAYIAEGPDITLAFIGDTSSTLYYDKDSVLIWAIPLDEDYVMVAHEKVE